MGAAASAVSAAEQQQLLDELRGEAAKPENADDVSDPAVEVARLRAALRRASSALARASASEPLPAHETHVVLDDGTEIVHRVDGSKLQVMKDGSRLESFRDGRRIQYYANGRTQETYPDGTRVTRTEDGKVVVKRPDGSKLQTNPDQTTIEVTKEGTMIQYNERTRVRIIVEPDGTQTQTNEGDGSMIQVFPDGTKIDTDSSGTRIVKYPDGRKVQRNPNGTVIESWADGHKVQTKADGSRLEVFPDGRKVQTLVDGSVIEQLKDGTQVRGREGTYKCVQCWRCQTISSAPGGNFVVSCRVCRNVLVCNTCAKSGSGPESALAKTKEAIEADVRTIFEHYDVNRSGTIERKELATLLVELQFPGDHFDSLFAKMDANGNSVLEWDEFQNFFRQMQVQLVETSNAPVLAMTQDLLQEQQRKIESEKARQEALYEQLKASGNAKEAANSATLCKQLRDEYEAKTEQLKQTIELKRQRQKKFLEKRLADRARETVKIGTTAQRDEEDAVG
jgi:hypothetical protein